MKQSASEIILDMPKPPGWTAVIDIGEPKEVRLLDPNYQLAGRSPIIEAVESGVVKSDVSADGFVPLPRIIIDEILQIELLSDITEND